MRVTRVVPDAGASRLVAYVVTWAGNVSSEGALEVCRSQLPAYMVPAVVIDADQSSCQTHRLNHPGVPVVTVLSPPCS